MICMHSYQILSFSSVYLESKWNTEQHVNQEAANKLKKPASSSDNSWVGCKRTELRVNVFAG